LEQFSKSKKPGTYIYSNRIINQVSQKMVMEIFYEVLADEKYDFSTSDPETLISTIGEILNSNPNSNLNLDEIDSDFDNSLDKNAKEIFTVILDHFKKMIKEQKTSLQISSNFITQKINNFSDSSDIKHKLLPIMEKKLSANKMNMTGGFKHGATLGGFALANNSQSNFKSTNFKKLGSSNAKEGNMESYQ